MWEVHGVGILDRSNLIFLESETDNSSPGGRILHFFNSLFGKANVCCSGLPCVNWAKTRRQNHNSALALSFFYLPVCLAHIDLKAECISTTVVSPFRPFGFQSVLHTGIDKSSKMRGWDEPRPFSVSFSCIFTWSGTEKNKTMKRKYERAEGCQIEYIALSCSFENLRVCE